MLIPICPKYITLVCPVCGIKIAGRNKHPKAMGTGGNILNSKTVNSGEEYGKTKSIPTN